ncbi:LysR family transcriptional regulator [Janthinobacterium agaricidamnosum]|uniref:Bacterial regulatory helix-turn-helix, lysR family protein n=1 Tax=Janthinobacterium agaricidamnosum NBRC 102515 = DSM 9628 TaxID=1349767 RepID=W0V939_9BURK|nr:LysR family transcriptional regulator [Janthinobacterium agaricidamnosum]CDG83863.1 bacterial regulatory helix-turn-helix, lysR family protein [Janthinobacterium agaricidamnosum NBRC 102515 = DSM 9628]
MDWDNARIFLAIYRAGTLRGAASLLHIDQATAGRRLAALEDSLGARLFLRTPSGYVATTAGELALTAAELMERAADQLQREMQGIDNRLSGTVRVATTDTMASHFVIAAMQRLHASHPDIRIVLMVGTQTTSLTRREADLAVRSPRPTDPDLISRHLAKRGLGLYAAKSYLEKHGEPQAGAGLAGHDIVIYHHSVAPRHAEKICGVPVAKARVVMEVNTGIMLQEACAAGLGIAELATHLGDIDPRLQRICPERIEYYDVWLVMHSDLSRSARVRAAADAIVASFPGK